MSFLSCRIYFGVFIRKLLSVIVPTLSILELSRGMNDNHESSNDKKDKIKAMANIPADGAIFTAAILLSGLSLIGSNQ
jgi:hypothetical protein